LHESAIVRTNAQNWPFFSWHYAILILVLVKDETRGFYPERLLKQQ